MEICAILVALALGIVLLLLAPFALRRYLARTWTAKWSKRFCLIRCWWKVAVGVALGLLLGLFVCRCYVEVRELLSGESCLFILFWALVLGLIAAFLLALKHLECQTPSAGGKLTTAGTLPVLGLLALAIVLLVWLARICSGGPLSLGASTCARLVLGVVVIFVAALLMRAMELAMCAESRPSTTGCMVGLRRRKIVLGVLLIIALLSLWRCRHHLRGEYELAMVGIHWTNEYGESGVHLRWGFRWGRLFPEEGFDLYRKPSDGGNWSLLNTEGRIHPVKVWEGTVPSPSVWRAAGRDRLPPSVWPDYEDGNTEEFEFLLTMLSHSDPYAPLFFVEGLAQPVTSSELENAKTQAATSLPESSPPPAIWEIEPMTLLMTMALHPEVARLLGLYYIDDTADPSVEYDYKVVGYWTGLTHDYEVKGLSKPVTESDPRLQLTPPEFSKAWSQKGMTRVKPDGTMWPYEATVGLLWEPPSQNPAISLTRDDGIKPVFYEPHRRDIGENGELVDDLGQQFKVIEEPGDNGVFEPIDPIVVGSIIQEDGFEWPEVFAYDNWVRYHHYEYRVIGIDVFGRRSPPSRILTVAVVDSVAPPPPMNVEARIFQRKDASIPEALHAQLFPVGEGNEFAMRVSWLWPNAYALMYPDLSRFQIHYIFDGYETFSDADNSSNWYDTEAWEGKLDDEVDSNEGQTAIPLRLHSPDPANPNELIAPEAVYYEETFRNLPGALTSALSAVDVLETSAVYRPVVYGYATVASVDQRDNVGSAGSRVVTFVRDVTPPPAPSAPRADGRPQSELDRSGNTRLGLTIPNAHHPYTYQVLRVRDRVLIDASLSEAVLPTTCEVDSDPDLSVQQRRAAANPSLYRKVNLAPVSPTDDSGYAEFTDVADGTVAQRFFYAARAIDPAGNVSEPSCPSVAILVRDGMPPAAPAVTNARSVEGGVVISWTENREGSEDNDKADLDSYKIYRTERSSHASSVRKMKLVAVLDSQGQPKAVSPSTVAADVSTQTADRTFTWTDSGLSGGNHYYRIVAVDVAENSSRLSAVVATRSIDVTPPSAPQWEFEDPVRWVDNGSDPPEVMIGWRAIDESGVRVLVQRRRSGSPQWLPITGWLTDTSSYTDATATKGEVYEYRLRAMDKAGHRSNWSAIESTEN